MLWLFLLPAASLGFLAGGPPGGGGAPTTRVALPKPLKADAQTPPSGSGGGEGNNKQADVATTKFLRAHGYVYDEERRVWTRPPKNMFLRRPAVVKSAFSHRAVEIRFRDDCAPQTVANGRAAAKRLAECLRGAQVKRVPTSPRSELEKVGASIVATSPWLLIAGQMGAWSSIGSFLAPLNTLAPPALPEPEVMALLLGVCASVFVAASATGLDDDFVTQARDTKRVVKHYSAAVTGGTWSGTLEGVAADATRGAFVFPAPAAWRANDDGWRQIAASLDLIAAFPRTLALHCALQAPLETNLARHLAFLRPDADGAAGDLLGAAGSVLFGGGGGGASSLQDLLSSSDLSSVVPLANVALAAALAVVATGLFSALAEVVVLGASDGDLADQDPSLLAECAAVREALAETEKDPPKSPSDALFRALARAYLERFDPAAAAAKTAKQKKFADQAPQAAANAFLRTAAAAAAFRLAGDNLLAPLALHALADLVAVATPKLQKLEFQDHDRIVVTLI